ncbi:MAG: MBG domain-containing protein [Clostridia bacterium]|nr:MBG domain-containing protein [Clostridia bacterium]
MNKRFLLVAVLVIILSCIGVLAACEGGELEEHSLVVLINDFQYNGNIANPTIDSNNEEYTIEWYSVSESGELTALESAPKDVGTYKVVVKLKNAEEIETQCTFTISQATSLIENLAVASKTYDGEAVASPTYTTNTDSTSISIKYRRIDTDPVGDWTSVAPKEIGSYEVSVVIAGNRNYNEASANTNFEIYEAPTFMDMYVNPGVEFMVAGDNTIASVSAINQDGCEMCELLLKAGVKGKSVDVAINMYMDILNEMGYFEVNDDIKIATQTNGVQQIATQAINAKLTQYGKSTVSVELETLTREDILDKAAACLVGYSMADIEAMDANTLRNLICASRIETENITSYVVEKIYLVEKERAILNAKLDAIIAAYNGNTTITDAFTSAKTTLNDTLDTLMDNLKKYYLSPASPYVTTYKMYHGLQAQVMSGLKAGKTEQDLMLEIAQVNNGLSTINNYAQSIDQALGQVIYALREQSSAINTLVGTLNVDIPALEEAATAAALKAVDDEYAKYLNYNMVTGEGAFIEGTNQYFYQCPQMNTTYVFNKLNGELVLYALDGIVELDKINNAKILYIAQAYSFGSSTTITAYLSPFEQYQFTINGTEVYLSFAEGEKAYLTSLSISIYDYTILLVTKDGVKKGYLFNNKVDENKVYSTPYAAECTWTENESLVQVDVYDTTLNYTVSNGNLTILHTEGDNVYIGYHESTGSSDPQILIYCNTVNNQNIAYLIGFSKDMIDGMTDIPYSAKGTWELGSDSKVRARFGDTMYIFVLENGELTFDKMIQGD